MESSKEEASSQCHASTTVRFDLDAAAARLEAISAGSCQAATTGCRGFTAKISPDNNTAAEDELRREIRSAGSQGCGLYRTAPVNTFINPQQELLH